MQTKTDTRLKWKHNKRKIRTKHKNKARRGGVQARKNQGGECMEVCQAMKKERQAREDEGKAQ